MYKPSRVCYQAIAKGNNQPDKHKMKKVQLASGTFAKILLSYSHRRRTKYYNDVMMLIRIIHVKKNIKLQPKYYID